MGWRGREVRGMDRGGEVREGGKWGREVRGGRKVGWRDGGGREVGRGKRWVRREVREGERGRGE